MTLSTDHKHSIIRILFTVPNFISAGSGQVMFNILTRLDASVFTPTICVQRKGGVLDARLESMGYKVLELPFTVPAKPYTSLPFRAYKVAKKFREYGFDLWHSFHYSDDYTEPMIARLSGAKAWIYTKKSMMWGSRAWIIRSLLASRIVADNAEMPLLFFNRFGMAKKTQVIVHGIPLDEFSPVSSIDTPKSQLHDIPADAFCVGCVAHLVPVKGHPTLIEAVSKLENVHLFLAGSALDQVYTNHLKEQVVNLGLKQRVHFLGNITDVSGFISQMDIVVLPTWDKWRKEAFGVVLIEAMACGKACIASDISGPRQIIEDGISGFLVPPEDPDELVRVIHDLQQDPELRIEIGLRARKRVVEYFDIQKEVAAHEKLYLEIISNT